MLGRRMLSVVFGFVVLVACAAQAQARDATRVIPEESNRNVQLREAVDAEIDALAPRLFELNDWMYHNPEPGFVEFEASRRLTEELERHGFEVEMGVTGLDPDFDRFKIVGGLAEDYDGPPGLPTAFRAKYGGKDEHPIIGFAVE